MKTTVGQGALLVDSLPSFLALLLGRQRSWIRLAGHHDGHRTVGVPYCTVSTVLLLLSNLCGLLGSVNLGCLVREVDLYLGFRAHRSTAR